MRKKVKISETAMLYGLFCVVFAPFAFIAFVVGGGAVKAVEACQRQFCGDALEEEREEGEGGVELEDRLRAEGGAEVAEGSGSREEERVGLIGGIEK